MKRQWFLLPTLLFALMQTGCGFEETPVSQKITQVVVAIKQEYTDVVKDIAKNYELQNPEVKIKVTDVAGNSADMHRILVSALSAKERLFDICEIEDVWMKEFVSKGYIDALTDAVPLSPEKYIPYAETVVFNNNQLYGIPFGLDSSALYYRKDLMSAEECNWDTLIQDARDIGIPRLAVQSADKDDMINLLTELIYYKGGDIKKGIGLYKQCLLASGKNVSSYDTERKYASDFKAGNVGCIRGWGSMISLMNDEQSKVRNRYGLTISKYNSNESVSIAKLSCLTVNKNTENFEASVNFLNYVNTESVEFQRVKKSGILPTFLNLYNDPMILDATPLAGQIKSQNSIIRTRKLMPDYMAVTAEIITALDNYILGTSDLDTVAKEVEKIIQ